MKKYKTIINGIKKVYEKLGKFNIALILSLLGFLYLLSGKTWIASFTEIKVHLESDTKVEIVDYDIQMEKYLSYPTASIEDNVVTISLFNYMDTLKGLEISVDASSVACTQVEVMSRKELLNDFEVLSERVQVVNNHNETTFVFSEDFITELNETMKNDWKLKLELILLVILFFVFIKFIELFVSRKWYKKSKYVCLLAFFMLFVFICGNDINKTRINDLKINGRAPTRDITQEETLYQSFIPTENAKGIQIRFSTYGSELQGTYEIRIYDELGNLVQNKSIQGSEIIDNAYHKLEFEKEIETGKKYKFTVVKTDDEFLEERLIMWRNYRDVYTDGDVEDLEYSILIGDLDFDFYEEGVNIQKYLLLLVIIFFVLILVCGRCVSDEKNFNKYVVGIYAGVLLVFLTKVVYCIDYENLGAYDELAHISYITYYVENPDKFVPDFKEVTLIIPEAQGRTYNNTDVAAIDQSKGIYYGRTTDTVNYLFHPALYYKLLSYTRSITSDGDLVHVNIDRLRMVNVAIIVLGLLILFYIGYTRIKKNAYYHLFYAAMCTSIPLLYYMAPMINNDNLCFLAITIYLLGVIQVSEGKRTFISYGCIAIGIFVAALTKFTALLMVGVISVFYVARIFAKEKNVSVLLNKNFLMTLPIYALAILYYVGTYVVNGRLRPSLFSILGLQAFNYPSLIKNASSRKYVALLDLLETYFTSFISQWSSRIITLYDSAFINDMGEFLCAMIFVLPIVLVVVNLKNKKEGENAHFFIFEGAVIAIVFAIYYQMVGGVTSFYGSTGRIASQSRYYLCMLPVLVYSIIYFINMKLEENHKLKGQILINDKGIPISSVINFILCTFAFLLICA